jgi:hypothetical protein
MVERLGLGADVVTSIGLEVTEVWPDAAKIRVRLPVVPVIFRSVNWT